MHRSAFTNLTLLPATKDVFLKTWTNHSFTADFKIPIMFLEPSTSDMRCYTHKPVNVSAWPCYKRKGIVPSWSWATMAVPIQGWVSHEFRNALQLTAVVLSHRPLVRFLLFHRSLRVQCSCFSVSKTPSGTNNCTMFKLAYAVSHQFLCQVMTEPVDWLKKKSNPVVGVISCLC